MLGGALRKNGKQLARAAAETALLADQISDFKEHGYVIIRKPTWHSTYESRYLTSLNTDILKQVKNLDSSLFYSMWKQWNQVSKADKRHSIPLEQSNTLSAILNFSIGYIRPFLDSQLTSSARLVELSSLIAMPGCEEQDVHSDIPFSHNDILISGFIALTDVNIENGPTHFVKGSHTEEIHNRINVKSTTAYYDNEGMIVDCSNDYSNKPAPSSEKLTTPKDNLETAEVLAKVNKVFGAPPLYAQLAAGDILLFNTMLLHYGGANKSLLPRALLCFSFQQENVTINNDQPSFDPIDGFTYHCHRSMKGKFRLHDFPNVHQSCEKSR